MILAKINDKYQITVPRGLRDSLNIEVGDSLFCRHQEGIITLSRKSVEARESSLHIIIRDRFQITLPVKKLHIRTIFAHPIVRIEQQGDEELCIRPIDPEQEFVLQPSIVRKNLVHSPLAQVGEPRRKRRKS